MKKQSEEILKVPKRKNKIIIYYVAPTMLNLIKVSAAVVLLTFSLPYFAHKHSSSGKDCAVCVIYNTSSKFLEEGILTVDTVSTTICTIEPEDEKFDLISIKDAKSRDPPQSSIIV